MSDATQGPTGADEPDPRGRRTHRRSVWTTIVASQLVIALVTATATWLVYRDLDDNIPDGQRIPHRVDAFVPDDADSDAPQRPLNILAMGSDTRVGAGNDDIGGANPEGTARSDTVILLHVSQDRSHAYGVSMPRDAIIDRPTCTGDDGKDIEGATGVRFNTAYEVGGPICTVQTVEVLTGIRIDHFVVLDFNGFRRMVDAVDGVQVCLPKAVADDEHNIYLDAGTQTLDGDQALDYVRERYQLSVTGDLGRMKRQQAFIASLIRKVRSAGTLSQPQRVVSFLDAVTSSIQTDDGLDSVSSLVDLAMQVRRTGLDKISFLTVPTEPDPDNPEVTLVWAPTAERLWESIKQDERLGRDFTAGSIAADDDLDGTPSASPSASPSDDPSTDPASPSSGPTEDPAEEEARREAGLCT